MSFKVTYTQIPLKTQKRLLKTSNSQKPKTSQSKRKSQNIKEYNATAN